MRIVIDATSLLLRSAGIKSYTYFWLQHLRRIAGADRIHAFPFLDSLGALDHERSMLSPLETYARLALLYFVNVPGNPALNFLPGDVFHASNQVRSPPANKKLTATVHDLTCWLMPEVHTAANVRADRRFADRVFRRADRLIAVSENTRQDAIRILKIDPDRIETIYSGVPDVFFDANPAPAAKPYVLFIGTIEPRKNLNTLLDAWEALKPDLREAFDLVVAGPIGWSSEGTAARLRSGIPGVRCPGYVPERDLPGLTAGATAFVYPSLYEGFGFPMAQAMAARVPLLTCNNSCLPEIAGDGALLVDARSSGEMRAALERLLTEPSLRARLAENGRMRAERYRWEDCARRSLAFFHKL